MLTTIQYIIAGIIFILSTIFFSNAIPALINRDKEEKIYFRGWLLLISGCAMFIYIISMPVLLINLKQLQKEVKNPTHYEIVQETLYKKK